MIIIGLRKARRENDMNAIAMKRFMEGVRNEMRDGKE